MRHWNWFFLLLAFGPVVPVLGQGQPEPNRSLRTAPRRLSQRVTDAKGQELRTIPKPVQSRRPLESFALQELKAFDRPQPAQAAAILKRIRDVEMAVAQARQKTGNTPFSAEVFLTNLRQIRDAASHEPDLVKDLNQLLIAALVTTETNHQDPTGQPVTLKTTTWGYRSLDVAQDWGPYIEFTPDSVQLIPVLNLLDKHELAEKTVPGSTIIDPVKTGPDPLKAENCPHDFDVINLHTHGLNVSPRWPADDIFRTIGPRQLKFFIYQIPPDQPPGTYFYHPHQHGSVADQVAGGMAGPLIVRDASRGLDRLGSTMGWGHDTEVVVMFQQLTLYSDKTTPSTRFTRPDFFALKDMELAKALLADRDDIRNVAVQLNKVDRLPAIETWVNGQFQPTLAEKIAPGAMRRLRLIHAGVEDNVDFDIKRADPNLPQPSIQVIAWDGIPLQKPYGVTDQQRLILSPGNRADVLVKFPDTVQPPAGQPVDYAIVQRGAMVNSSTVLATFSVDPSLPAVTTGRFLSDADAQGLEATCRPVVSQPVENTSVPFVLDFKDADFSAIDNNPGKYLFNAGTFKINKYPFAGDQRVFELLKSRYLSMVVVSGDKPHPIHIHVNSFLVPPDNARGTWGLPTGEFWADTLLIQQGSPVTVKMPFSNWSGDTVAHCHILDHEDAGMMNLLHIRPVAMSHPEFPLHPVLDRSHFSKAQLRTLVTNWPRKNIPVPSAHPRAATVFIFMPTERDGSACVHCAESVKLVAKLREHAKDAKSLRIVAVSAASADKLPSPAALGLLPECDVLCSDPELQAFEAFSLVDGTPHISETGEVTFPMSFHPGTRRLSWSRDLMHGVFITDPRGKVVSIRRGFLPADDTPQILKEAELALHGHAAVRRKFEDLLPRAATPLAKKRLQQQLDTLDDRERQFTQSPQ